MPASNSFDDVLDAAVSRRALLVGGVSTAVASFFAPSLLGTAAAGGKGNPLAGKPSGATSPVLGFTPVAPTTADTVTVPDGYVVDTLYRWGDSIRGTGGRFAGAGITLAEQEAAAGNSHDGMHFFPLVSRGPNQRGLLVLNHEITETEFLFADGEATWDAGKSALSMAAQGVSVIEVKRTGNTWKVVPSGYARRITSTTPMELTGPAAGADLLKTSADPSGTTVLGTLNNCANGYTPWGTYFTCEENFNAYFGFTGTDTRTDAQKALAGSYGLVADNYGPPLYLTEDRFDLVKEPNESNRFGWVVEIDPFDPTSTPKKRTALGRIKHENAELVVAPDGRVVVYMGDDERGERIYKFVSSAVLTDDNADTILDSGTLHVARFEAGDTAGDGAGTGTWLPLTPETVPGWSLSQILIDTRGAASVVGGTRMDRPEWISASTTTPGSVYCTLTNNTNRGVSSSQPVDEANPRAVNRYGHIIRWDEAGGDPTATTFTWDIFLLAGDPAVPAHGATPGIDPFGSPDGLWFDGAGNLWVQTDGSQPVACNNQMLVADPATKQIKRFLVGPVGCEITGITSTPDGSALFVNIQHPGEGGSASDWPDKVGGLPRSSTIVIRRADGAPASGGTAD